MRKALALVLLAALAAGPARAGAPEPSGVARSGVRRPAPAAYWTSARMQAARVARPLPSGSATTPVRARTTASPESSLVTGDLTRYPYSTHGKVFFTDPGTGGDYVCSGTVVASPTDSLVVTAGHCVYDESRWMANWAFVPAYDEGDAPLGIWAARELFTTSGWSSRGAFRADVGAALVVRGPARVGLAEITGARGMRWGREALVRYRSFGYPAEWPFSGEDMRSCRGPAVGRDGDSGAAPVALSCDMTGGSSGGGWIVGGSYLQSVTSYGYDDEPGVLYGPYFSKQVAALYAAAAGRSKAPAPHEPDPTAAR